MRALFFYFLSLRSSSIVRVEAVITAPATSPADFQKNSSYNIMMQLETTASVVAPC
jgi:hypothetical protein